MAGVVDELRAQILQNTNNIKVLTELVGGLNTTVGNAVVAFVNYKWMALSFFLITVASFFLAYGLTLIVLDKIGVINFYREGLRIRISTIAKGEMVEVTRKKKEKKAKKPKLKKKKKPKVKKEKRSLFKKKKKVDENQKWENIKENLEAK